MYTFLTTLPRPVKFGILLSVDLILVLLAYYLAFVLRLNDPWPISYMADTSGLLVLLLVGGIVLFFGLRLHAVKLGASETHAFSRTALWVTALMLLGTFANLAFDMGAPRTVPVIFGTLLLIFSTMARLAALNILSGLEYRSANRIPVAIYGAGAAGLQLVSALKKSREYKPALFVDDNVSLHGLIMAGLPVCPPEKLTKYLSAGRAQKVFLAIPTLEEDKKRVILKELAATGVEIKALPSYVEMIDGGGLVENLRPVSPEDLLGRDKILPDMPEIMKTYSGRSVLVSGAGGSIGSELCRQVVAAGARQLTLFEHSEFGLYQIEQELAPLAEASGVKLVPVLGSVTDPVVTQATLRREEVDIVLHAAAYKHVPLIEANELAGAENNVLGTRTMAQAAMAAGVRRFILVSTDKAVRPTNVMGATKRLAEMVIQDLQTRSDATIFSMVRFGNVLGSSGSVIPLFRKQIAAGGPVTLTHQDVTRYFMTIPEAARLVLLAGSYAEGGEVFVLDMGQPVKIRDLAARMIELSGLTVKDDANPRGDIEIALTGLRPGEKLYEELLIDAKTLPTPHPKILRAEEQHLSEIETARIVQGLTAALAQNDSTGVREVVQTWVAGYKRPDVSNS